MPFFSIIIPVYNVAPYLRECLDSVLAQTLTDWEAICVDDGSTDGSGAILDEYASRDQRIKVIHQKNAGVSTARNNGLDNANGKWIWFVDADDALHPCALKTIMDAVCVHQDANSVRVGYLEEETCPKEWDREEISQQKFYPTPCDEGLLMFFGGMWSVIIRRKAIGGIRLEPFPRGEDSVFLFACARNGFGCVDICRKLYFYRQRHGSATHIKVNQEVVAINFECQRRQIENFTESVRLLGSPQAPRSWGLLFSICYRTYYGMYFLLPPKERDNLIGKWIGNIDMFNGRCALPAGMRARVALIKLTRSGYLVRWFALGRVRFMESLMRILRKIKGAS